MDDRAQRFKKGQFVKWKIANQRREILCEVIEPLPAFSGRVQVRIVETSRLTHVCTRNLYDLGHTFR